MAAQKIKSSTQKFIEIQDIVDDVVLLRGGNSCLIIGVQATNFALLSREEQMAKIGAYAALLNSLSFSIQIIVRNKRVNISSYLKLLDTEAEKIASSPQVNASVQSEKLAGHIKLYRDFVAEMTKVNVVLDKKFYIVISYSPLEKGIVLPQKQDYIGQAKVALHTKAESLLTQLNRLSLKAVVLNKEELVRLFFDIYNQDLGEASDLAGGVQATVVKTA